MLVNNDFRYLFSLTPVSFAERSSRKRDSHNMRAEEDDLARRTEKVRRSWAKQADRYDSAIGFFERRVFGTEHREWACRRATGEALEVAIGTALNLPYYPHDEATTRCSSRPALSGRTVTATPSEVKWDGLNRRSVGLALLAATSVGEGAALCPYGDRDS